MKWAGWFLAAALICAWILTFPSAPQPVGGLPESPPPQAEELLRQVEELQEENQDLRLQIEAHESSPPARIPSLPPAPTKEEPPLPSSATFSSSTPATFAMVQGLVLAQGSRKLQGLSIRIDGKDLGYEASAKTAADGSYRFMLPPGSYRIQIRTKESKARPSAEEILLGPGQTLEKNFLLPFALLEVSFLSWENREPFTAWNESLPRLRSGKERYEPEALSNGHLQFLGIPDGVYEPVFENKEFEAAKEFSVTVGSGLATPLLVKRRAIVQVCLVDASGNPFQEKVQLEWSRRGPPANPRGEKGRENRNLNPTPDGCHSISLREGSYLLVFRRPKTAPFYQTELQMPGAGTVPLRVVVP